MGIHGHASLPPFPCQTLWAPCKLEFCLCHLFGQFSLPTKISLGVVGSPTARIPKVHVRVGHSMPISFTSSLGAAWGQEWVLTLGNPTQSAQLSPLSAQGLHPPSIYSQCLFPKGLFEMCQSNWWSCLFWWKYFFLATSNQPLWLFPPPPFCIRNLSILKFWYPWGIPGTNSPQIPKSNCVFQVGAVVPKDINWIFTWYFQNFTMANKCIYPETYFVFWNVSASTFFTLYFSPGYVLCSLNIFCSVSSTVPWTHGCFLYDDDSTNLMT